MSTSLFQYPKSLHARKLSPRVFKHYRTYKRYLQTEFSRVCVYCRQPDSSAPNLNFGVDHYRPKGIPRFAHLICDYVNLYYCCGNCNSRKSNDWPTNEKAGPYVVNPCDHVMAAHLWFDGKTGRVEPKSPYGKHTEALLQLNDPATVAYRLNTLRTVRWGQEEINKLQEELKLIGRLLRAGKISKAEHDSDALDINKELAAARGVLDAHQGTAPLPPLRKTLFGVSLP